MEYREFGFMSSTGKELVAYAWEVEGSPGGGMSQGTDRDAGDLANRRQGAKANIVLVHGLGEHTGRYGELAEFLNGQGYNVYGFDLTGFGKSPGQRGYVGSFEEYLQDLRRFVLIHTDCWHQRTFLLGSSMGGLLVLAFGTQYPGLVCGSIVTSPALQMYPISGFLEKIVAVCNRYLPWLSFSNRLQAEILSHDPEVGEGYRIDPLTHDRITPRLFSEMRSWMRYVLEHGDQLRDPLLLMYGGQDQIVDPAGAQRLAAQLTGEFSKVICYEEMYHEVWNEVEKEQVWAEIVQWLEEVQAVQ